MPEHAAFDLTGAVEQKAIEHVEKLGMKADVAFQELNDIMRLQADMLNRSIGIMEVLARVLDKTAL